VPSSHPWAALRLCIVRCRDGIVNLPSVIPPPFATIQDVMAPPGSSPRDEAKEGTVFRLPRPAPANMCTSRYTVIKRQWPGPGLSVFVVFFWYSLAFFRPYAYFPTGAISIPPPPGFCCFPPTSHLLFFLRENSPPSAGVFLPLCPTPHSSLAEH